MILSTFRLNSNIRNNGHSLKAFQREILLLSPKQHNQHKLFRKNCNKFDIDSSYNKGLNDTSVTEWISQIKHDTTYEDLKVTKKDNSEV